MRLSQDWTCASCRPKAHGGKESNAGSSRAAQRGPTTVCTGLYNTRIHGTVPWFRKLTAVMRRRGEARWDEARVRNYYAPMTPKTSKSLPGHGHGHERERGCGRRGRGRGCRYTVDAEADVLVNANAEEETRGKTRTAIGEQQQLYCAVLYCAVLDCAVLRRAATVREDLVTETHDTHS